MAECQRLNAAAVACFVVITFSFGVVEVGANQCENATAEGWISEGGSNIYCASVTEQIFLACSDALGVADPSIISDGQINASSSLSSQYNGSHVRLDDSNGWIPAVSDNNQYVIIDLAALPRVTGITLQAAPSGSSRVVNFVVKKSFDGVEFQSYKEEGSLVTFQGPTPGGSVSYEFQEPFSARYVQVTPKSWSSGITMRLELYGCYEATKDGKNEIISSRTLSGWYVFNSVFRYYYEKFGTSGTVVSGKVTVDSMAASSEGTGTNAAEYGDYKRYSNAGCWIATDTSNQWLQADFGIHTMITKIELKGASANNAVETYYVYYSSDGINFSPYQFREQTVLINGPEAGSGTTLELESFASVLITRYIRIYPQSWTGTYPAVTVRFIGTSIVAADCDTWYSEGFTDPGYYYIEKNNEEVVTYCPFGVSQDSLKLSPEYSFKWFFWYCTDRDCKTTATYCPIWCPFFKYNSCQSYFEAGYSVTGYYQVDPDGSGGEGAFEVYCDFDTIISGAILTYVTHDYQDSTFIDQDNSGYGQPGTYEVELIYGGSATGAVVNAMAAIQFQCFQYIYYKCKQTKIWDGDDQYTWWEAADGSQMTNWGGVATDNSGCLCGQHGTCRGGTSLKCHCDEENERFLYDTGYLVDSSKLPVNKMLFGDHGGSGESAYYKVGQLFCFDPGSMELPVPLSCLDVANNGFSTSGFYAIDADDFTGPNDIFIVYCDFDSVENAVKTIIGHDLRGWRQVAGYAGNGGWGRDINYDYLVNVDQVAVLIDASTACRQVFHYQAYEGARINLNVKSWWSNRDYSKTNYLSSPTKSRKCPCALLGQCYDPDENCNSNAGVAVMLEDGGWLAYRPDLPITQLFLGDTGGSKYVEFQLGELECYEEISTPLASCYEMKLNGDSGSGYYLVDPDGSGGEDPFVVYCNLDYNSTHAEMILSHDSENETSVTGHSSEGEYMKMITYEGMTYNQLISLFDIDQTEMSMGCVQFISYQCYNSRLLEGNYTWWVSRTGEIKRFWGGSEQEGYCACGETSSCAVSSDTCNCASQQSGWLDDAGDLMDWFTEYLPVMQLRIGDTGTAGVSEGIFMLGKLFCYLGPGDLLDGWKKDKMADDKKDYATICS